MKDRVLSFLLFRKISARLVTFLRRNEFLSGFARSIGLLGSSAWAGTKNQAQYEKLSFDYRVDFIKLIRGELTPVGLIAKSSDEVVASFIRSCEELKLEYEIYDPFEEAFIDRIRETAIQKFIVRPSHTTQLVRQMFFEKVEIVASEIGKIVYPSIKELKIYEAKRTLSYFLKANSIPHPKTWVFYDESEAIEFIETANFPLVFKTHNGSSASGVEILQTKARARSLIKTCFRSYYINKSISDYRDIDYGYVLLQEYIEGAREFRIIKIGESWMGHEKAYNGLTDFMSGSGVNLWTKPSDKIFDFCRNVSDRHKFTTMCFDVFESPKGEILVNELQTWFGSYNPSQMYVDGVPGRLHFDRGVYKFHPGLFNHNQSVSLRLVDLLNIPIDS